VARAAINPALVVTSEIPPKKLGDVFIYYSNETAPDESEQENYKTIIGWLRTSADPKVLRIAGQLESDLRDFRSAVDFETASLKQTFRMAPSDDTSAALIFTNRLSRDGNFEVLLPGISEARVGRFPILKNPDLILRSNPLGTLDGLKAALKIAAIEFDPRLHNFVLVTKSHGKRDLAFTPRLAVLASETSPGEILSVARADGETSENAPRWVINRRGLAKASYFQSISEAGAQTGLFFSAIFMESCASEDLDGGDSGPSAKNIGLLFTTQGSTPYRTLDYGSIFAGRRAGESISARLVASLEKKSASYGVPSRKTEIPTFWYFVPLAAFCGYALSSWVRGRITSKRHLPTSRDAS